MELLDGQPVGTGLDEGFGPDEGEEDVGGDEDEVGEVEEDEQGLGRGREGGKGG